MDEYQRRLFREALLDNIRHRSAKDVNQFIETLHEKERKATLFPSPSDRASHNATEFLHEACELGKFDTFTILVNYCVIYNADIAATNSEGYSVIEFAALLGRKKFIEFLENRIGLAVLVPNRESFQRLVRISCQMGNRELVEHWLYKMTEHLNRPLNADDFVSGIDPVTEAFKAGFHDMACDIFKRNIVKITESMYVQTGTFLSERLHEMVEQVDVDGMDNESEQQVYYRAQWYNKSIWFFHSSWLQTTKMQSESLQTIDLSSNHLEIIPDELLWNLPHVQQLLLSQNDLISLPALSDNNDVERSSLIKLDVSYNKLVSVPADIFMFPKMKTLNLSHNYIHRLPYDLSSDGPDVYSLRCRALTSLDVSHNQLGTLPLWITRCAMQLTTLNISNNKMETLLPSWKCPLERLDASHNNISEMSVCDFHTHWAHTMITLNMSHNEFTEIPDTVCQLTVLNNLDISRNVISYLPPEHLWTTRHLTKLDLTSNRLMCNYGDENSKRSSTATFYKDLVIPKVMHNSLKSLFLGSNQLRSVPKTVCEIRELAVLDLSGNQDLIRLPYALCCLRKLFSLRLKNTPVSEPHDIVAFLNNPRELLQKLRETYENSKPFHQVKVIITGPQNAGKTTLVRSLWDSADGLDTGKPIDIVSRKFKQHVGLSTLHRTLRGEALYRDIDFNVWDLKGGDSLELIHRCCVTPNTIYLLVWDLNGDVNEIDKLLPWWLTIKSVASGSQVILVGTHKNSTRRKLNTMVQFLENVKDTIKTKFQEDMKICFVDTSTTSKGQPQKHGFHGLETDLIKCVNKLKYECRGSSYSFSKLMIPESFLLLKDRIASELNRMQERSGYPRILTESNIQTYINEIPNSCLKSEDDLNEALDFLNYTGSLIHVSDRKYGVGRLYFPDPSWLCEVVNSVSDIPQSDLEVSGTITKDHLKRLCRTSGFGKENFKEFEQLLKSFEIIMPFFDNNTNYWIPCKLPTEKPAIEFRHEGPETKQLCRIYRLPYIPPGFWTHLVSRIITGVEQRKKNSALRKHRSRTLSASGLLRPHSMVEGASQGGDFSNVYWQTGILVPHETGKLLVENLAATYITSYNSDDEKIGVCITVTCRLGRFSIMGLVVDEVENLITNWYPDLGFSQMYRHIPCPICEVRVSYRERSDSGRRRSDPTRIVSSHLFAVEDLSTTVCKTLDETVQCPNHDDERVVLRYLIPDIFLDDLDVTILAKEKFQFRQKTKYKIGSGGFGDVYRGEYDGKTVAVKCFAKQAHARAVSLLPHANAVGKETEVDIKTEPVKMRRSKTSLTNIKRRFSNLSGHSKVMFMEKHTKSLSKKVHNEAATEFNHEKESSTPFAEKLSSSTSGSTSGSFDPDVINSFSQLRNELTVMCQLHHPYIVSLIGASLQSLCFAMEYAPLGDLNTLLQEKHDAEMAKLPIGKHIEHQGTIMGRQLSYKLASQIAHGLVYLHTMGITHADLKPANVLVFSKELDDPINAKITDYGVSRIVDHSGNKGRVGTPGFRAPEIGHDLLFDKQADWFSYGRLLYQLVTGVSPSHHFKEDSQVKEIDEDASKGRFVFVRYSLQTSFPLFIAVMRACWRDNPQERPRDSRILSALRDVSILALRHVIELDSFARSCPIVTSTGDYQIHTWTGGKLSGRRRYQLLSADYGRPFAKPQLHIGSPVRCVLQVGIYNFIGTTEDRTIHVFECSAESDGYILKEAVNLDIPVPATSLYYQQIAFDERGYLFAGLENGTTSVFEINPSEEPENWILKSMIKLGNASMSCNGFQPARGGKELWVACGNTLRIINTNDLSISSGVINVAADEDAVSNDSARQQDVQSITGHQSKIWCCLKGSNKVIEYSTQSREKINAFTLQSANQYDSITALTVVKDSLWIGKSTGDIVVVNIADKLVEVSENGEVPPVAVLSLHAMVNKRDASVSQIVRAGKDRILVCMHYKDEDSEKTGGNNGFMVVWESWGSEDFERFHRLQPLEGED